MVNTGVILIAGLIKAETLLPVPTAKLETVPSACARTVESWVAWYKSQVELTLACAFATVVC